VDIGCVPMLFALLVRALKGKSDGAT